MSILCPIYIYIHINIDIMISQNNMTHAYKHPESSAKKNIAWLLGRDQAQGVFVSHDLHLGHPWATAQQLLRTSAREDASRRPPRWSPSESACPQRLTVLSLGKTSLLMPPEHGYFIWYFPLILHGNWSLVNHIQKWMVIFPWYIQQNVTIDGLSWEKKTLIHGDGHWGNWSSPVWKDGWYMGIT